MSSQTVTSAGACESNHVKYVILAFVALLTAGLLAARTRTNPSVATDRHHAIEQYAGNAACAGCHQKESQDFARSGHARALFRADSGEAANLVDERSSPQQNDPDPKHGRIEFKRVDGRLRAVALESSNGELPIDWCFGSGEFGMTFVTLLQDRFGRSRLLEHHWSWFRDGDVLAQTPGHTVTNQASGLEFFGQVYDPGATRMCFSCHTTAFRYDGARIDTASMIPGVQCERCHGPQRDHVERMLRTKSPQSTKTRTPPPARQQVYACGECHRRPDEINDEIRPNNPVIARFPSVGLVQSKCFLATEAQGTLTCVTCHDPHGAEHPPAGFYDGKCRDCHDPRRDPRNIACSAEPGDRSCIGCHMPKLPLHTNLKFTDHWIRPVRVSNENLLRSNLKQAIRGRAGIPSPLYSWERE